MTDEDAGFALRVMAAIPGSLSKRDPNNCWGETGKLGDSFRCPKCGTPIWWKRAKSNGHIRASCERNTKGISCFGILA